MKTSIRLGSRIKAIGSSCSLTGECLLGDTSYVGKQEFGIRKFLGLANIVSVLLCINLAAWAVDPNFPPPTKPWVRFDLYPVEAVQAGAQWRFADETAWRQSGVYYTNISEGTYTVEFKPTPGWMLPMFNPPVTIRENSQVQLWGFYDKETTQPESPIEFQVTIYPAEAVEAGARWKLGVDTEWRDPRVHQTNLPAVETYIEFKPIEGWIQPQNFPVSLRSGMLGGILPSYKPIQSSYFAKLMVVSIHPLQAVTEGAQWKFTTQSEWHDPFSYVTNVPEGLLEVEFKPLPGWMAPANKKIWLLEGDKGTLGIGYARRPQFLVTVNATNGMIAHHTLQWQNVDGGAFERQSDWRAAEQILKEWDYDPRFGGKLGDKVRLTAMADPGYQFAGWSGDVSGLRNPVPLVLDSDKNVTAHFVPVSTNDLTATQSAEGFYSPATLMVHAQVSLPLGRTWDSFTWRPILPEGWSLGTVNGLGNPKLQNGSIVFTNLQYFNPALFDPEFEMGKLDTYIPINPVQFTMEINVPAGQTGTNLIQGEITYAWKVGTNLVNGIINANPIQWIRQEPPLALLTLDVSAGPPILVVHGEPGISFSIQRRTIDLFPPWWSNAVYLRLTNSARTWIDTSAADPPRGYIYRAVLLE